MNISKILLIGSLATVCFSSCMNEEFPTTSSKQGSITLNVDNLKPTPTRAVATDDFPVSIYTCAGGKLVDSYEKVSMVPNKIVLSVGSYFAESHTPGKLDKIMDAPYYLGRDTFEILADINTVSNVVCRMANGSFTVRFTDDFVQAFSDWSVSIDDGTVSAILYEKKDGQEPPVTYMTFEDGVEVLNTNFVGTTKDGNRISASNKLTKKQASEQYDSDNTAFSGGDAIVIVFDPVESTEGGVTGITLRADISFEETEEEFEMEVEDNTTSDGDDTPDSGDTPSGNTNAITLELPEDMTVGFDTDPSLGDTHIEAENGIKSIKVKVSSTSEDMISSLQDLSAEYDVDFIAGAEVVGNNNMVTLFEKLYQTLSVPSEGDTEYTFPIGNFFMFLAILPGEHTFDLVITDMEGNTKDGVLKLTVAE